MARAPDSERGIYLSTGWRVVGGAAESIVASYSGERLEPGSRADTLYALQCTFEPKAGGRATVEHVLDAITDEVRRTWPACPRLLRDEAVNEPPSRFGGLRFEYRWEANREWVGELVWRAVHPQVAGASITTRLLIEERRSFTRMSLRVTSRGGPSGVRGFVGAGQAQPRFLRALRQEGLTPYWSGGPLMIHVVEMGGVRHLVDSVLGAADRDLPAAVLAPLEEGGYVVEPVDLMWELLGRARLYVLKQHRQTFELSDAVEDRRMSCYWGAARVYMPGWTRHDDPYDHPLLMGDRLADPIMRAEWLGRTGMWLGTRLELPDSIEERTAATSPGARLTDAADRSPADSAEAASTVWPEASARPDEAVPKAQDALAANSTAVPLGDVPVAAPPPDLSPLLGKLIADVHGLVSIVGGLRDEVERLRTIAAVRSSSTNAIERRLGRLEDILERVFPGGRVVDATEITRSGVQDEPAHPAEPLEDEDWQTLVDVVRDIAEYHDDALTFLDTAYTSAADSPYEDPERVRAILEAMARVARRRLGGQLGTSLREAFSDLGIEYRGAISRATSARMREQYRFSRGSESITAEEHIVLGNTYDPRRCLRIYFTSRAPDEARFIIAHVGRHFDVRSTT